MHEKSTVIFRPVPDFQCIKMNHIWGKAVDMKINIMNCTLAT